MRAEYSISEWRALFVLLLQHTHIFYHRSGDCNSKLDFFLHPMNKALLTRAGENQEAVTALPAAQLPPWLSFLCTQDPVCHQGACSSSNHSAAACSLGNNGGFSACDLENPNPLLCVWPRERAWASSFLEPFLHNVERQINPLLLLTMSRKRHFIPGRLAFLEERK